MSDTRLIDDEISEAINQIKMCLDDDVKKELLANLAGLYEVKRDLIAYDFKYWLHLRGSI